MTDRPFSRTVPVADIVRDPKTYSIDADAEERAALAAQMGIPEVASLHADLEVRPLANRSFGVKGSLDADVVQTCVVSLDPVEETVSEAIDVTLIPAPDDGVTEEQLIDSEAAGGPGYYDNGRIDIGAIVAEHLALGLDPYPRKPGLEFEGHIEDLPTPAESPFARLAALKPKGE